MERAKSIKIINQWRTTEINPQEISDVLCGRLEESLDLDSKWNIHLHYGRRHPLIIIKCDPEKRRMFLAVPAPKYQGHIAYRCTAKFVNVEELLFVQTQLSTPTRVVTDMLVNVRDSGSGLMAADMIVSSLAHRTFGE